MRKKDERTDRAWADIRDQHEAFWNCEAVVLEGTKRTSAFTLGDLNLGRPGDVLTPEDLDVTETLRWADRLYDVGNGYLDGDLVWGAPPLPGFPWAEAICGSSIRRESDGSSLWPGRWISNWEEFFRYDLDLTSNRWFSCLKSLVHGLSVGIGDRYPMTMPLIQGPSDILAAARGMDAFCLDFIDNPEAIASAVDRVTDLWITMATILFDIIPAWDGGYPAPRLEVWAPGRLIRIEEDATILLSPEMYRDFFLDADRRVFSAFEFSLIHTHSANYKIWPFLADIQELSGIQVLIDTMGPPIEDLITPLRSLQEAGKPILITHELEEEDLKYLKSKLSPYGLALERMPS